MKKLLLILIFFTALPLFAQRYLEIAYETSSYTYRELINQAGCNI